MRLLPRRRRRLRYSRQRSTGRTDCFATCNSISHPRFNFSAMNFDFKVEFAREATLQGAVKLSSDDKLTPLSHYFKDEGERRNAEWGIKTDIKPRDELYLNYNLKVNLKTPDRLPLLIQGIAGLSSAHSEQHEVSKLWKSVTIRISGFSTKSSTSQFHVSVLDPTAILPKRVEQYFKNPGTKGNSRGPLKTKSSYGGGGYGGALPVAGSSQEGFISPNADYSLDDGDAYGVEQPKPEPLSSPAVPDTSFPVWYATNRQSIHDDEGKLLSFSTERASTTTYGKCLVDIPESHVIGETRANFWQRVWLTVTLRKDASALRLLGIQPASTTAAYWAEIQHAAAQWPINQRCGLVFIHGYNVSFEDAAIRAAQIGADLQIRGPVGFFSWPSQGTLLGYAADEASIEASEAQITQYLLNFARESNTDRVHIIAHSMGNRGLLRALQRIAATAEANAPKIFEQIILAAPDVDKALFLSLADHYHRLARHTTLYVSNKDLALASSRMLRTGMDRAGLTPPVTIAPDIDTVNVTNIDVTLLGHGYVAEARDVLADMHQLIYHNTSPDERMGLRPAEEGGQRYWIIGA